MQDERDIVVFTDDEGNDFELEVMDYFFCNGQEYAVLSDADAEGEECGCEECAHDHDECDDEECGCGDQEVYIMKIEQMDDDMEEFVPVEDDALLEKLIAMLRRNEKIDKSRINYAVELAKEGNADMIDAIMQDVIAITYRGKQVKCKTLGQRQYVKSVKDNLMTFAVGPAAPARPILR